MPKPSTSLFGRRLRDARQRAGLAQDRLGVLIGLDEGCSSARISRYETGTHAPPYDLTVRLAGVLNVPAAYFYCDDEWLARLLLIAAALDLPSRKRLLGYAERLGKTRERQKMG